MLVVYVSVSLLPLLSVSFSVHINRFTFGAKINKSSAVAEMGDRLVTIGMGQKWGGAGVGTWVPI